MAWTTEAQTRSHDNQTRSHDVNTAVRATNANPQSDGLRCIARQSATTRVRGTACHACRALRHVCGLHTGHICAKRCG
jgi:hypothetical protein